MSFLRTPACIVASFALWASPALAPAQHLYWANERGIERASIDGGGRTQFLASDSPIFGLALDPQASELYWLTDFSVNKANLTGSPVVEVGDYSDTIDFTPLWALALDTQGQLSGGQPRMYFSSDNRIHGANLDGTDMDVAITFTNDDPEVYSIGIDFEEQRFFWSVGNS